MPTTAPSWGPDSADRGTERPLRSGAPPGPSRGGARLPARQRPRARPAALRAERSPRHPAARPRPVHPLRARAGGPPGSTRPTPAAYGCRASRTPSGRHALVYTSYRQMALAHGLAEDAAWTEVPVGTLFEKWPPDVDAWLNGGGELGFPLDPADISTVADIAAGLEVDEAYEIGPDDAYTDFPGPARAGPGRLRGGAGALRRARGAGGAAGLPPAGGAGRPDLADPAGARRPGRRHRRGAGPARSPPR